MHFAYEGFIQNGSRRSFLFRGVEERGSEDVFSIEVDLQLFAQNHVSFQGGPSFCLQLLTRASAAGPIQLERLHSYLVVGEDFRPLIVERQKLEAEKAVKSRTRRAYRKPPFRSNVWIGKP